MKSQTIFIELDKKYTTSNIIPMKPKRLWLLRFFTLLILFVLLLKPVFVNSATLDKSLFTGNKKELLKKYRSILKSKNNPPAQKILILTLIKILNSKPNLLEIEKFEVKNQNDFLILLKKLANIKLLKSRISEKIKDIEEKLSKLKDDIEQIPDNSTKLTLLELQFALYTFTKNRLLKEQAYINSHIKNWMETLYKYFSVVQFKPGSFKNLIKKLNSRYKTIETQIQELNIELDRYEILNDTKSKAIVEGRLKSLLRERDATLERIIDYSIIEKLSEIKKNRAVDLSKIRSLIERLKNRELVRLEKEECNLVIYIEKRKLGSLKVLTKQFKFSVYNLLSSAWHFINKPLFSIGSNGVSIMSIVLALLIFIAGIKVGRIYKTKVRTVNLPKSFTESTRVVISNVGFYIIIATTFFISLKVIGINLSSLTVILGALSVGVGFGLQNIVSNFIAGIILMLENSIRIGDYIEISNDLRGIVKDIHIRSTTILTNDHIEVVVPNQTLFQNSVVNWTLSERIRRFRIPFSVAYGTKVEKVEKAVLEALEKSDLNYIRDNPAKKPMVVFTAMNDSSIDFNLDVWVSGIDLIYPRRTTSKFLKLIYNALYENNIEIPFPQMDLHFKNELKVRKED